MTISLFHQPSGRYYSIDRFGQRKHWGGDNELAIDRYRAGLQLCPLRNMTDDEAVKRLIDSGVDDDVTNPELIRMAKQNRFVFDIDWIQRANMCIGPKRRAG